MHSHNWGRGIFVWFGNRLPWIHWLTPKDILSEELTTLSGSKHLPGGTPRIYLLAVYLTNCHFQSLQTFFFLVEYKNNYTKTQIPIPIQGVYKLLCMFTWRRPSLFHAFSTLLKKQNVFIRLWIIYWRSDSSSLKFIEDFSWPTSYIKRSELETYILMPHTENCSNPGFLQAYLSTTTTKSVNFSFLVLQRAQSWNRIIGAPLFTIHSLRDPKLVVSLRSFLISSVEKPRVSLDIETTRPVRGLSALESRAKIQKLCMLR